MRKNNHFAIVDIETTGGHPSNEKITEVAIYKLDGHEIIDKFVSLVNPERTIQDFVVKLTGITNDMVRQAPKFHEIAKRIVEITEDCTFVAHNVDFDYKVIRKEFKNLGYDYDKHTLCTVKLSKSLIPDLPSYSLGKLCRSLGIPITNRHRAEGDAFATVKLFELLLQKDQEKNIITQQIINFDTFFQKEKIKQSLDKVPDKVGVFYIHQSNGRIMYIGKGKNIKSKIHEFFAKKSIKVKTILTKMADVSFEETGNYVMARLKFNQEVEQHKPKYNSNYLNFAEIIEFNHPDMILISEGRKTSEKAIVLLENNELKGYGYADLAYQIEHVDILKNILTPLSNSRDNRYIIKSSILKNRFQKIIRL